MSGPLSPYKINWEFISAEILIVPVENLTVWFWYEIEATQQFGNGSEEFSIYFDDIDALNSFSYNFGMINETVSFDLFPKESDDE